LNYFEHHIGDYDEATAHLTACEDGIYSRLLRKYYATEKPLERDTDKLKRLVRARNREEKIAVDTVLAEFFSLADDGWHQEKCDEIIAAYQAGEPEREVKKANEDNRLKRHREERAKLFKILTDAGEHASWNIPMADLREMAKRIQEADALGAAKGVIGRVSATPAPPFPATAPATPATATQTPLTTYHSPLVSIPVGSNEPTTAFPEKAAETDLLGPIPETGVPECPHQRIRELWAELLPELQQTVKWTAARATLLRCRWREEAVEHKWTSEEDGLRFFAKLFRWCRKSKFLMGQIPARTPGATPFALTLPWLTKAENWAKVQEGNFHSEG
jgi:uncharacterized protein YdaU (DUF1376 family)